MGRRTDSGGASKRGASAVAVAAHSDVCLTCSQQKKKGEERLSGRHFAVNGLAAF